MKVTDPNLTSLAASQAAKTQGTSPSGAAGVTRNPQQDSAKGSDDVHLSELVRTLRTLAADSPERQAYVDQIAKSYASGNYQVDAHGTAGKIIDDAFGTTSTSK